MIVRRILIYVCRKRTKYRARNLFGVLFLCASIFILKNFYTGLTNNSYHTFEIPKRVVSIRQACTGRTGNCDKFVSVFTEISKQNGRFGADASIPPLLNFDDQPCVSGLTPSEELSSQGGCVRTIQRSDSELSNIDKECVNLTIHDIVAPVCIYNTTQDKYISEYLRSQGTWEELLIFGIIRLLNIHKGSVFLDLGCNIGAFTIAAAKAHRHVVAVDPLITNLELLSKSLHIGGLTENVTLIWNAVSLERSTVTLKRYEGNVGGTAINDIDSPIDNITDTVNTIKLDDIQELFIGKPTIIKMDVETQELNALRSGELFFQTIDVKVVLLEFNWHKDKMSGIEIFTFMEGHGFMPFEDSRGHMPLNIADRRRWPGEVFFIKQEYFNDFLRNV